MTPRPDPSKLLTRNAVSLLRRCNVTTVNRCLNLPSGHPNELIGEMVTFRGAETPMIRYEDAMRWVKPPPGWKKGLKRKSETPKEGTK